MALAYPGPAPGPALCGAGRAPEAAGSRLTFNRESSSLKVAGVEVGIADEREPCALLAGVFAYGPPACGTRAGVFDLAGAAAPPGIWFEAICGDDVGWGVDAREWIGLFEPDAVPWAARACMTCRSAC